MIESAYICDICMTVYLERTAAYECCDGESSSHVYICPDCKSAHAEQTCAMNCCSEGLICQAGEIPINAIVVASIINAFIGPPHLIRELQALYKPYIPDNPVSKFIDAYNDGAMRYNHYMEAQIDKPLRGTPTGTPTDPPRTETGARETAQGISRTEGQDQRDVQQEDTFPHGATQLGDSK